MDRKAKGKAGEELATKWLVEHGHEILERNYQLGNAEIDIISLIDNHLLVFTEVKWRSGHRFGHPEEFVSTEQGQRIVKTADAYIHAINWSQDVRFDIISIDEKTGELRHFPDAFY